MYPEAVGERIANVVKMALFPPSALRALDPLTKNLVGHYNPLIIGRILLAHDRWLEFAARTVRNLQYPPLEISTGQIAARIITWQNRLLLDLASKVVEIPVDSPHPPKPHSPDVGSFCPRCLAQFTHRKETAPTVPELCCTQS